MGGWRSLRRGWRRVHDGAALLAWLAFGVALMLVSACRPSPTQAASQPTFAPLTPFPSVYPTQAISTQILPTPDRDQLDSVHRPPLPQLPPEPANPGSVSNSLKQVVASHRAGALHADERTFYNIGPDDRILVVIQANPVHVTATFAAVEALGSTVESRADIYGATFLTARAPLSQILALEQIPTIITVNLSGAPMSQSPAGSAQSMAEAAQAAPGSPQRRPSFHHDRRRRYSLPT